MYVASPKHTQTPHLLNIVPVPLLSVLSVARVGVSDRTRASGSRFVRQRIGFTGPTLNGCRRFGGRRSDGPTTTSRM